MKKSSRGVVTQTKARNPAVTAFATLVLLIGIAMTALGVLYVSPLGWYAVPVILGGLACIFLATMTLITGKSEWILIGLIYNGLNGI